MNKNIGKLIVISAPSGTGKTTVVKKLLEKDHDMVASVSFTTRPKRDNEEDGVDYYFVEKEVFKKMKNEGIFLEDAIVFGHFYGTKKDHIYELLEIGKNVILEIDWQGAKQIRGKMSECILIFLIPPSKKVLLKRLKNRATDSKQEIQNRFSQAVQDLEQSENFDYVLVNDDINESVKNIALCIKGGKELMEQTENVQLAIASFHETN